MLFYEIKVHYDRQTGEDNPGKVKETYLVEGLTCADVETRLIESIKPFIFGDVEVPKCNKAQYFDIFPSEEGDRWYKARVEMITVEDNGKESRKAVSILVEASDIEKAQKLLQKNLEAVDCEIVSIARSPIIEVLRAV
ncbi:MAG: DUF4494 domain-containing protein [Paludibacteraceae bacterium]|nr:DUF4494 domain-containing protein [Paludibacteraceae bacterium]